MAERPRRSAATPSPSSTQRRPRLLGSVPLDSRPAAIAYGAGSIWVSYPDAPSVARISPSARRVVASISLDRPAQGLAATNRSLWAVGSSPTDTFLTLDQIDPTFDTVARVRRLPMVDAGDSGSIAAERDTVVVAPRAGYLTRIDARSGRTLSRIDPNVAPTAVAQGFGSSWLAYREANLVVRIDETTGAITTIPVGRGPSAVTVGRRAVWVTDELDGTVKSIDPATSSVITTVKVGTAPSAITHGDGSVWVANAGDGTLTRIDERTSRPTARVAVGGSPQALVVAEGKVWVSVQPPPAAEPTGGTLVVSVPRDITVFDPAFAQAIDEGSIVSAICSTLLNYPDEPGLAGLQLVPDAARAAPTVSDGGRSYTFVIRPGLRFSPPSNELVTAETFKHTIERSLSPRKSMGLGGSGPGQIELPDVVGAAAYMAGKAQHIAGISARGDRLTIRVTHPAPDLPKRLATSPFCAVPSNMPLRPVSSQFPSAGPYYIAAATPRRSLVLLRNPNYHGDRPRRPQRIDVVIGPQHPIEAVEASRLDYAIDGVPADRSAGLERLYGAGSPAARRGEQQYFVVRRSSEVDMVRLNTSSAPLRERAHATRGQLRRRPKSLGGDRRHLLRACDGRADVSPARRPGLPRRAHLSAQTGCRRGPSSRRPRPSHSVALLLSGRRQPASSPDHRQEPRRDRHRRPGEVLPGRPVLDPHAETRRTLGSGRRRVGRRSRRSRRLPRRVREPRGVQRLAPPRSPRRLAPRVGRAQVRSRARRSPTPGSTMPSFAMPRLRSPLPTRARTTSSRLASAARSTRRGAAWSSELSASGPGAARLGLGRSVPSTPSRTERGLHRRMRACISSFWSSPELRRTSGRNWS